MHQTFFHICFYDQKLIEIGELIGLRIDVCFLWAFVPRPEMSDVSELLSKLLSDDSLLSS